MSNLNRKRKASDQLSPYSRDLEDVQNAQNDVSEPKFTFKKAKAKKNTTAENSALKGIFGSISFNKETNTNSLDSSLNNINNCTDSKGFLNNVNSSITNKNKNHIYNKNTNINTQTDNFFAQKTEPIIFDKFNDTNKLKVVNKENTTKNIFEINDYSESQNKDEAIAGLNKSFLKTIQNVLCVQSTKNLNYYFEQYNKFLEEIEKNKNA